MKTSQKNKIKDWLVSMNQSPDGHDMENLRLLLREKCKRSLWFLARYVLQHKDTDTELHRDMARAWSIRARKLFSLWLIPRGHLKTTLWTEDGTIHDIINNKDERHIIINAKLENAIDILANIRSQWESNEILRWLFPEYCVDLVDRKLARRCKWGVDRLDFPCSVYAGRKEGSIEVMGVEASLVSKHYDVFTFDDPVNDLNTTTRAYRNKIEKWYRDALQLRHDPGKSRVRMIGTRWHRDDLYGRIIDSEKKRRKRLKEHNETVIPRYWIYHRKVVEPAPEGTGTDIVGKKDVRPIWPERFTPQVIEETREENGSFIFSCQYMNEPVSGEQSIFKMEDIKFVEGFMIPDEINNFLSIDLAVSDKDESDYSAITVASFDSVGNMYVRECLRQRMMPRDALEHIWRLCNKWNVKRVGIETVAFQQTVYKYYLEICSQEGWNIPWVELKRSASKKSARFLALQPRVERGQFYIEEGIQQIDEILDEMTGFSLDHLPPYDDILDTLADLEQLYYRASEAPPEKQDSQSFDAFHGVILEDDYRTLTWANPFL